MRGVFGIDALFFNPNQRTIYFGESKVCNSIENAITLVNRSFDDYEEQIAEEYKLSPQKIIRSFIFQQLSKSTLSSRIQPCIMMR